MSFSSVELLEAYRDKGQFPAIHDAIFAQVSQHAKGRSFCDLGACTGLLTRRLATIDGAKVCGIEGNPRFIASGREHGIDMPILALKVSQRTFGEFSDFIERHKVDVLVARRVMPELWGEDLDGGVAFSSLLASLGVREIFIEGRIYSDRSTNALAKLETELRLFAAEYDSSFLTDTIGYLTLR